MKVHRTLAMAAMAALVVWGTAASEEQQGIKIGVVDIEQAISSTEEGKAARDEFARKQRDAEAKVQPMLDRFRALEEELKAKKFVLSDDALYQKQLDLAQMRNEIDSKLRELDGQLKVDQQRLQGPLVQKLEGIIEEFGKSQGFTLIIRRGAPGVLYAREALDVTSLVIERYNKKKS